MDRESESTFLLQPCVHSKNIFTLADLPPEDETHQKIKKHVDNCRVCSVNYGKFKLQSEAMKIYVPRPKIDRESREIFEREISELFKIFDLNEKAAGKKKLQQKIRLMDSVGAEFLKNLTSKAMIKSYLLALLTFACLRYYLN